jgi:proline iminopeptidase
VRKAREITSLQGIEELKTVEIGGIKQWIPIRGRDRRNPILLFIHGGAGESEVPSTWLYQSPWEDYFTVVQWDQRGAGKTGSVSELQAMATTMSIPRMVSDGEEMVDFTRALPFTNPRRCCEAFVDSGLATAQESIARYPSDFT